MSNQFIVLVMLFVLLDLCIGIISSGFNLSKGLKFPMTGAILKKLKGSIKKLLSDPKFWIGLIIGTLAGYYAGIHP